MKVQNVIKIEPEDASKIRGITNWVYNTDFEEVKQ